MFFLKDKRRKGMTLSQLPAVAIMFVVAGVVLGMGAYINSEIATTAGWATNSTESWSVS